MKLLDRVVTRFMSPISFFALDILSWTRPEKSVACLFASLSLCYHIAYAPCILLACLGWWHLSRRRTHMLEPKLETNDMGKAIMAKAFQKQILRAANKFKRNRKLRNAVSMKEECHKEANDDKEDELHLSSLITSMSIIAPRWVKEWVRSLHPILAQVVLAVDAIHGAARWDPKSLLTGEIMHGMIWTFAAMYLLLPFWLVTVSAMIFLFTMMTPVMTLIIGLFNYLTRSEPARILPGSHMVCEPEWKSKHAIRKEQRHKYRHSDFKNERLKEVAL
eukprot:GEMP01014324.1.p1 GENE.GEMP01014324.1~~GEMP01014324.1.p1  ORF type:complete len:276 (+),score=27.14 GEMP01014324.1:1058-1885(+)